MNGVMRICLLGLGEVGGVLAEHLLEQTDARLTVWDRLLDDPASLPAVTLQSLLPSGRVAAAQSAATAADGCEVILSAVTAGQAVAVAESVLPSIGQGTWFVDFNSVSPDTKKCVGRAVESSGAQFVEVAVMSPIHPAGCCSPMLLAGPTAEAFLPVGRELGFGAMSVASDSAGQAAATKMCRSVVIKGMEALLAESLLCARFYGVEASVIASLGNLFPGIDWEEKGRYMISRSLAHGARRAEEMEEAAKTVSEAGVAPWMSDATVRRQRWAAEHRSALTSASLDDMLDAIANETKQQRGTI